MGNKKDALSDSELKGGISKPFKGMFRKIKKAIVGSEYDLFALWDHQKRRGLVWKIPDPFKVGAKNIPHGPEEMGKMYGFGVREYETAVVLDKGEITEIVKVGYYKLEEDSRWPGTEIIFVDNREFKIDWGVKEAYSSDNVMVGAYGRAYIKLSDPINFIKNVDRRVFEYNVQSTYNEFAATKEGDVYDGEHFQYSINEFMKDSLIGILRDVMGHLNVVNLYRDRDIFINNVREKTGQVIDRWGLELTNIEILGVKVPEEYKQTLTLEADKKSLAAQQELQQQKIAFATEQKLKTAEMAHQIAAMEIERKKAEKSIDVSLETERMKGLAEAQQKGLNVAQVLQADGVKEMLTKSEIKANSLEGLGGISVTSAAADSEKFEEIKKAEIMLGKLDEKLIDGTISEQKHEELSRRYKEKLTRLKGL